MRSHGTAAAVINDATPNDQNILAGSVRFASVRAVQTEGSGAKNGVCVMCFLILLELAAVIAYVCL